MTEIRHESEGDLQSLRPVLKSQFHQDSVFGNSFQSRSFFVVHPEWLSETITDANQVPLHRPPWPWEQPRYRQNIQIPITYQPIEKLPDPDENKNKSKEEEENANSCYAPYKLPISYKYTHPGMEQTKPFEKHTQFGVPIVDTSIYKLGY